MKKHTTALDTTVLLATTFDIDHLSHREQQVLGLIIEGASNKSIAKQLGISPETVKVFCKRINAKLGVSGRIDIYVQTLRSIRKGRCSQCMAANKA